MDGSTASDVMMTEKNRRRCRRTGYKKERRRGDVRKAWKGDRVEVTVDGVRGLGEDDEE